MSYNITEDSLYALHEYQIERHNYVLSLLTNLEGVLRGPTIFLYNMTKNGTDLILVNERKSRPYLDEQKIFATTRKQPTHVVIRDLLSRRDMQGVYDHLLRTAIGDLLWATRNVFGLMKVVHDDIVETIESMIPFPAKQINLRTTDANLYDPDDKISISMNKGTKCLARLDKKMPWIKQHLKNDVQAFIDESIPFATVGEKTSWEKMSADNQFEVYSRSLWSVITKEWVGVEGGSWDGTGHEAVTKKFMSFIQHPHVKELTGIVTDMERFEAELEDWRKHQPHPPKLEFYD